MLYKLQMCGVNTLKIRVNTLKVPSIQVDLKLKIS